MPRWDDRVLVMDVHAEPVAKESWDFFFAFFEEAGKMGKHVVVEGGWAVAAYGSPVASVDLDVIIRQDEHEGDHDFYDLLHGEGRFNRPSTLSAIDWNFADFNHAWASARGYDRGRILEGRTRTIVLQAPDGRKQDLVVPTLPVLLMMKLKAFRDRELQFRVMQDPAEIASYDPHEIDQVNPREDYRLRKAAKDLVDVGYLWAVASEDEQREAMALLAKTRLRDLVAKAFEDVDQLVTSAADYLIDKHGLRGSAAEIRDALRSAL